MKMNQIQIKKAIRAGNSSAVILPRSWLNKEVRVELVKKTPEMILFDVMDILKEYLDLSEVAGIYLTGSYARNEEETDSDIDILIITNNTDKEMIIQGVYNILIISTELLSQKLKNDLFPVGQMIREAKPLLNSEYLEKIEIKITKDNIKWYLDTTDEKIALIEKIIAVSMANKKRYLSDRVIYTLILRIRTMYIILNIINQKKYSKKEFISSLKNVTHSTNAYGRYLSYKKNLKEKNEISVEEARALNEYLKKLLLEVKEKLK
jgi:predicted nucleotidyltransferase